MSFKKITAILLIGIVLIVSLCGCSSDSSTSSETVTVNSSDVFSDRDLETDYDESQAQTLSLNNESVTIKEEGIYVLSGSISDGQIIINASDSAKIQIVLNGVDITSSNSAAIYVKEADKVFITLAKGSDNKLSTSGEFQADGDTNLDGVIFSKSDLTLNGTGKLSVLASTGNGIVSKDDLKLTSGTYTINTSGKSLEANDILAIADGTYSLTSQEDAIHCDTDVAIFGGSFDISSEDDAIHATNALNIQGGDIKASKCYEGLEGKEIHITDGKISIIASDDGINAAGGNDSSGSSREGFNDEFSAQEGVIINISGGDIYISCEGDGIDSNGDVSISGGNIVVEGPQNGGNGALDYNGSASISGGTILAIGSSSMAMNFTEASQGSILVNFNYSYSNEKITVTDSDSNVIYEFESSKTINSILFSSADLKKGETYTITIGDQYQSVTLDDYIYGSSSGMGGMGGMR